MNFQELAVKRYSVRNFRQTSIPEAVIDQNYCGSHPQGT